MDNPELHIRLRALGFEIFGKEIDIEGFCQEKPLQLDPRNLDLLLDLIKDTSDFSNKFWEVYVRASISSTKMNSVPSLKDLYKLIKMAKEKSQESGDIEDKELLDTLIKFISSNSMLSVGSRGAISPHYWDDYGYIQEVVSEEYKRLSISKGKVRLLEALLILYGITARHMEIDEHKKYEDQPTKDNLDLFFSMNLLKGNNFSGSGMDDTELEMIMEQSEKRLWVDLERFEIAEASWFESRELEMFKNKITYVRLNSDGHFIPNFATLWDNLDSSISGKDAYKLIINSIEYLQNNLAARGTLFGFGEPYEISLEELCLISGLQNIKTLKNELLESTSLLERSENDVNCVTVMSAIKWLKDPKRRKSKYYELIKEPLIVSLEEIKAIYNSEN